MKMGFHSFLYWQVFLMRYCVNIEPHSVSYIHLLIFFYCLSDRVNDFRLLNHGFK